MSQENMEIVRRAVAAFNARNRNELLGLMDPEIEYQSLMEQKIYRGLDGMVQYRDDVDACWRTSTQKTTGSWTSGKTAC